MDAFTHLKGRLRKIADLEGTLSLLSWDQETEMPPEGAVVRAGQRAFLSSVAHELLGDPRIGDWIEEVSLDGLSPEDRRVVQIVRRRHKKAIRLPAELVTELAEESSLAYEDWVRAREAGDYRIFQPRLRKIFQLKKEEAECLDWGDSLYDGLLDEYEPDARTAELRKVFESLKPELTRLLERIRTSSAWRTAPSLHDHYPVSRQEQIGRELLTAIGFNWKSGRLDRSHHPFCIGIHPNDVRITSRYQEHDFTCSFFGILHEGGHALYEQGLLDEDYGLPTCSAISLGLHESQSRLWENIIGRSGSFWRFWLTRIRGVFPGTRAARLNHEKFLRAVNKVQPSPIRVEADEVTYGIHIILRFEIELAVIEGRLEVADIPDYWNEKMEDYLGIRPRDDREGVLQDTHWSQGLVGYFPTYLLGNLYSAQIAQRLREELPSLDEELTRGDFENLREWLRKHIHRVGRRKTAGELIQELSGMPLSSRPFIDYLQGKYERLFPASC